MTVFNHFFRKEEISFDGEQETDNVAFKVIRLHPPETPPIGALGEFAHRMADQRAPAIPLFADTEAIVETAQASEALKAGGQQMRDNFIGTLAAVLSEAGNLPSDSEWATSNPQRTPSWLS